MDIDQADRDESLVSRYGKKRKISNNANGPVGPFDTQTNLPHVKLCTQPSFADIEWVATIPQIDPVSEEDRISLGKRGVFSMELAAEIVAEPSYEEEDTLERRNWPVLPGMFDFAPPWKRVDITDIL